MDTIGVQESLFFSYNPLDVKRCNSMLKKPAVLVLIAITALTSLAQNGQSGSKPAAKVTETNLMATVSVEVTSPERNLYVPTCGNDDELCFIPSRVEAKTANGWHTIGFGPHVGAVLGGTLPSSWKSQVVAAGQTRRFRISFSKYLYVRSGQRLRVVVAAWPDEASLKNDDKNRIELVTESFECP